jgi:hypothetical protein
MNPADPNINTSYFEAIESTFVSRRGKHLMVGPADWQLMEDWQDSGIPVHVVVGAINEVFNQRDKGQRTATISSLRYCSPAVDAAFQQWQKSRVGANESVPGAGATGSNNPFSKESILKHLARVNAALSKAADTRHQNTVMCTTTCAPLCGVSLAIQISLAELITGVTNGKILTKQLEEELSNFDAHLDQAIKGAAMPEQLSEDRAAITSMLAPHRSKLTDEIYQQQFNNFFMKRLRESFGIPRLSLFFS